MIDDFEVDPLFEGQVHEILQFKLNIQGNDYQGYLEDGEIKWFNPQPQNDLKEEHFEAVESQVHVLMRNHLQ